MLRNILKIVIPTVLLLVAGCRSSPIYDVPSASVVTPRPVTMQDVEKAILRAGGGLGWQLVPTGPGRMEGVLALRTHRAVVDITYDTGKYSIKYKDSSNLDYDGKNIHTNYNGWVQNLEKAIRTQLSLI